jgi:nucleotide-binding universal stress UspA family protein
MTIVVGYVPTQTGRLAVTEAAREARTRDTDVVVVNAVDAMGFLAPTAADENDLDAVTARFTDAGVRSSLRQLNVQHSAADAILEVARAVSASLVVLGLHQRSWLAKRAFSSTVRSVVLAAPCSVLVVPDVDEHMRTHQTPDPPPLRFMGQE